ncbi:quinone-dependent dihydroorotate dehydrogenase [Legionella micdadei]|uniref:Dihydroorotate dehydrogenase (quinone) n=1 Tax=Legionella micdadei TaxID=451 RepID=A0A098GFM1_LEGMI|nr:quinone-dependent dihydroorotate dehydrogenase [Legionella micdadei]ARG98077.1 dihydroorotate dehydrogenase (quinone) [Legionella micdadei]ARH00872.1 dihydroorotate dehydrogenase (quinone) [Legionella micdadei]KTD30091.1 Dihydroorotate dehydrogenase [Legionella micdadei]NSL18534.1 quinone-dependent dihydroorotate dehydrogenase [Legionella micdadei]CEG60286.1 Dihydroorotate dehydrogenase [Legionella micdadei]
MYSSIRPFLFCLDAEKAHGFTLSALHWLPRCCFKQPVGREVTAMGLKFPHPIGLAAGLDKNGEHLDALSKIGFSFIEIGTVTPYPQIGNPKPRLFRLPKAAAIINRMGFNNLGVDVLIENVKKANYRGILGINIGKNKDTPLTRAAGDYLHCLRKIYQHASYITINISSPNTPDLRLLQQQKFFSDLIGKLCEEQKRLADSHQRFVPLVIKLSPDEPDETLKEIANIIVELGVSGIIATNTSCEREGVSSLPYGTEQGGLSGRPIAKRATHCLRVLKQVVGNDVALIGVGGIDSPEIAQDKINAGANLLQVYTGLIYQGPGLVAELAASLR